MRFQKPRGQRINRYFCGVTNFECLWWVPHINTWVTSSEIKGRSAQTHAPCRTVKAFRRHLRKHPEIRGKAILVSRYKGYDVYA